MPEEEDLILVQFICGYGDQDQSNPKNVFLSLANQIARHNDQYSLRLADAVDDTVINGPITQQFEKLFEVMIPSIHPPIVHNVFILIDGLDECGTQIEQKELARCLLDLTQVHPRFKVFVSSRETLAIHSIFRDDSRCLEHDIEDDPNAEGDIREYINGRLDSMRLKKLQGHELDLFMKKFKPRVFRTYKTYLDELSRSDDRMRDLFKFLGTREHNNNRRGDLRRLRKYKSMPLEGSASADL